MNTRWARGANCDHCARFSRARARLRAVEKQPARRHGMLHCIGRSFHGVPVSRLNRLAAAALLATLAAAGESHAATLVADPAATGGPSYYLNLVAQLQPGDTLQLPAGVYRQRLNLSGVQGTPAAWITITGPTSGAAAVITTDSNCCNNVQLGNTAYVAIKNLTIDSNSETVNE